MESRDWPRTQKVRPSHHSLLPSKSHLPHFPDHPYSLFAPPSQLSSQSPRNPLLPSIPPLPQHPRRDQDLCFRKKKTAKRGLTGAGSTRQSGQDKTLVEAGELGPSVCQGHIHSQNFCSNIYPDFYQHTAGSLYQHGRRLSEMN